MDRALQARLEQDALLRTATEWFFELRSNEISVERIGEWQRWLAADAGNRQAFERVESFWRMGSQAVTMHWPTDAEVAADTYDGNDGISEWRRSSHRRRLVHTAGLRRALAAGVAVAVIALALTAFMQWPRWRAALAGEAEVAVKTTVGETRTLPLPDGSTVAVGGNTALTATFASTAREVTLERGEAFFHVAKEAARPFTVRAGNAAITAIGTAFNVRRAGGRVVVAVSEGAVRVATQRSNASGTLGVAPAHLEAGQQLRVAATNEVAQVAPVDTAAVAGWRQGRLQYLDEPLETVVADLARYSTRDIRIADARVARLRVTGIVFEQNIDGWLASLQATFPVQVIREADGAVRLKSAAVN